MKLSTTPLFERLHGARSVLIAGAGGGFDVFCGLPLAFALLDAGVEVHLANLTFSNLYHAPAEAHLGPHLTRVDADTPGSAHYFPEGLLCGWLRDQGAPLPIYCLHRVGVAPLRAAWRTLHEHVGFDTLVLVDGGTDSLMRGDEAGLGTPQEDAASLLATRPLDLERKFLICVGFGVDAFHGVCHAHFLRAVAELTTTGAFLGATSLLPHHDEVQRYIQAAEHVFARMPDAVSIVNSSIMSAIEGRYGDVHRTDRTAGSTLWINPLMALMWAFELDPVADRLLYRSWIEDTVGWMDLTLRIEAFRKTIPHLPREIIPV